MQFRLKTLLLVFVVAASALAGGGVWGLVVTAYLICLVMTFRIGWKRRSLAPARLAMALVVAAPIVVALLLPAISSARQAVSFRHSSSTHDLHQLALAMRCYHDQYGSFPPAYVADKNGKPMHSWRVLLLPFMEYPRLYDKFRLDEPWDSPHNRKAAALVPDAFLNRHAGNDAGTTGWVAVTGPGTAWSGEKGCSLGEMTDGPEKTLLVVGIANSSIPWNAPIDLTLDDIRTRNTSRGIPVAGFDTQGPAGHLLTADGTVHYVRRPTNAQLLERLATIAGSESVQDLGDLEKPYPLESPRQPDIPLWRRAAGWIVWLASFLFLVSRPLPAKFRVPAAPSDPPAILPDLPKQETD